MTRAPARSGAGLACCLWLAACGSPDDDLRRWMDDARRHHHEVPSAPAPAASPAMLRYEPGTRSDPFSVALLNAADEASAGSGLQPDLHRAREPLESYPLANLRLIGSLRRNGDAVALIEAEQHVYSVRIGAHVGQDFGKVVAIGERAVDIDELVPDSSGRWVQRRAQLALQEPK